MVEMSENEKPTVHSRDIPVLWDSGLFWCLGTVIEWSLATHLAIQRIDGGESVK